MFVIMRECVSFPLDVKFISEIDQRLQNLNRQVVLMRLLLMSKTIVSRSS